MGRCSSPDLFRSTLRIAILAATLGFMTAQPAGAADVVAPVLQAGDTWTYRHIDGYNKLDVGTVSSVVEAAGPNEVRLATRSVNGLVNFESTYAGPGQLASGTLSERAAGAMHPPLQLTRYPLREGERWVQNVVRDDVMSREKRETEMRVRVIGWETVKVPAGEFRALLIERAFELGDYDPFRGPTLRYEREWYAPEVKGPVKLEVFEEYFESRYSRLGLPAPGTRATYELLSYKVG
ncbi:MAG: hypothetical protein WCE38_16250 [Burkholderiales bacterium]